MPKRAAVTRFAEAEGLQIIAEYIDLTSAFDQELRQRAQRSVLEREDSDLPVCRGEFDGQFPQRPVFGGEFQDRGWDEREKDSIYRQPDAHIGDRASPPYHRSPQISLRTVADPLKGFHVRGGRGLLNTSDARSPSAAPTLA
jgi:hypothetical protein